MKDENEDLLSNFRRRVTNTFRRRVYVAVVMALAILLSCVALWPLSARNFQTTASLRVQISPRLEQTSQGSTDGTVSVDEEYFHRALQDSVREAITDDSLASCIRRAVMKQQTGLAPMTTQQLRDSLEIRVSRPVSDARVREIRVTRNAHGSAMDQQIVNLIIQELSGQLSRKANYKVIQEQVQRQVDQVALQGQRWTAELLTLVLETRSQCRQFDTQLDRLALKLKEAGQNHQVVSGELKDHIEQVQQQVLTSDLQLLRTLREQILAHFEVDETDSMVQHLEHLIGDREGVLAQLEQGMGSPPSAVNPRNVRTNPFMVASYRDNHQTEVNQELQTSQSMLAGIRLDETYRLLDQLRLSLENPVVGRIPIVPFEREIETQPAHFQVTELKTSGVPQPTDGVPSDRWMLGLGLVAGLIGAAFSLQWQPFQLGRQISNSRQLADMLGLELMGSLSGGREKPGVLERFLVRLGAGAFRVAEVALLLFLCGVIVAMIWDQQLPGIIVDRPVTGFCRAIWVLFGR